MNSSNFQSTSVAEEDPLPAKGEPEEIIEKKFNRLKQAVFNKRPVLSEIYDKRGHKSLCAYAQDYFDVHETPEILARREELLSVIWEEVNASLDNKIADDVVRQMRKYYFVSTADHHGPICHPFFLSSNLLTAITGSEQNDKDFTNVIVLACGSVSLDNSSFPRGLVFNSLANEQLKFQKVAFFSSHERPALVSLLRAYGKDEIAKIKKMVLDLNRNNLINADVCDSMHFIINQIYDRADILSLPNFSKQITRSNYFLWKMYYEKCNFKSPNLIYLELEEVVRKVILNFHLDCDTIINRIMFNDKYQISLLNHFDNVPDAFSLEHHWGTFLFWAVPKGERYRIQLWKKGNTLASEDGKYVLPLTPAAVREALEKKEIIPGLMLNFIILSFYYGLKCLGGFSQVNYLTFMKEAYQKMLVDVDVDPLADVSAVNQTKELVGDVIVAFTGSKNNTLVPSSGLDFILYNTNISWQILSEEIHNITLAEALSPMMPEFYRIIYPDQEREQDLINITAEEIIKHIGLDKKIKPCMFV